MKKLVSLALVLVMVAAMAFSASATAPTAKSNLSVPEVKTAPKIDGVRDEAYQLTFDIRGNDLIDKTNADGDYCYPDPSQGRKDENIATLNKIGTKAYFMWDKTNLYVYLELDDPDMVKMTDDTTTSNASRIEFILYNPNAEGTQRKLYVALNKNGDGGVQAENPIVLNPKDDFDAVLKVDGKKILIEMAINWEKMGLKDMKAGSTFKFAYSQAAMTPNYTTYAIGGCFARKMDKGIPATLEAYKEPQKPADPPKEEDKPAKTADPIAVVVVAVLASACAVAVVSKKRFN